MNADYSLFVHYIIVITHESWGLSRGPAGARGMEAPTFMCNNCFIALALYNIAYTSIGTILYYIHMQLPPGQFIQPKSSLHHP